MQYFYISGIGGGAGTGWDGEVDTYTDLESLSPADHTDEVWLVNNGEGIWLINRKPAGWYKSDGANWNYLGRRKESFYDANFKLVNASDTNKVGKFDLSKIPTGTTKTLWFEQEFDYYVKAGDWADLVTALEGGLYATIFVPDGTYTCTDDEATPIAVNANVKRIVGQSKSGTIIDANCATNTSIQDFITIPSIDCAVENLTIKNFGNGFYAAIKGTVNATYSRATNIVNCHFENILNGSSRCVQNCTATTITAINDSSVGTYGRGILAYACYGVFNCRSEYLYTLAQISENIVGNYVYYSGNAIYNSKCIDSNTITNCWRGIYGCSDVGFGNKIASAGSADYSGCIFHNTYRDNTDNTKAYTDDISGITTGTTRNHKRLDNDGTLALFASSITPVNNGDLAIETTSDTTLTFKFKGSDGIVRSSTITLA